MALAALAFLALAVDICPITANDTFLHLRTGASVLATGQVPRVDDYSALARGRPFIAHEWLAGVVFRLVEIGGGLDGLTVLKTVIALLCAAALYATARTLGASPAVAVPTLAFVIILAGQQMVVRPQIFSYLFAAFFLLLLARRRTGARAALWWFLPIQVAWVNLHGGFLLGPAIVSLACAAETLEGLFIGLCSRATTRGGSETARQRLREAAHLAGLVAALVAASLLNPYGSTLLKFPFQLMSSPFMGKIYEWRSPFSIEYVHTYMLREYVAWGLFGLGVLLLTVVAVARRQSAPRGGIFPALLFVALLVLSLRSLRFVTDFGLYTCPGVAAMATWVFPVSPMRRTKGIGLVLIIPILLGLGVWFAWNGYAFDVTSRRRFGFGVGQIVPVAGADYLRDNGVRGNAFNTYTAGAYLLYRFYPQVRVSIDSRNDVYGPDLYREYTRARTDSDALAALLKRIEASFAFLELQRGEPIEKTLEAFQKIGGWRIVYFDDFTVILVPQDGQWAALATRDGYSVIDPARYRPGSIPLQEAAIFLDEATRAVRQSHGAFIARLIRVEALLVLGRRSEALEEEARIVGAKPLYYHSKIFTNLGILRYWAGDLPEAASHFRRALALDPRDRAAALGLQKISGPR
jgi:hypothetical protein